MNVTAASIGHYKTRLNPTCAGKKRVQGDLKKGGSYHCIKIFNKDIDNKKRTHHIVLEEKLMQQS